MENVPALDECLSGAVLQDEWVGDMVVHKSQLPRPPCIPAENQRLYLCMHVRTITGH